MKKAFYWGSTILQVLFLITALVIQEFSMKRMGMMRYVVYINHQWEAQYPIAMLRYTLIAFLLALSIIIILYALVKKGKNTLDKTTISMLVGEEIFTLAFVFFVLSYSAESYRSYYVTSLILAIIALIQNVKVFAHLKR